MSALKPVSYTHLDVYKRQDMDFDTGRPTRASEYSLADKTYAHLLDDLAKHNFDQASPELRQNILRFYGDPNAQVATKKNAKAWKTIQEELDKLKAGNTNPPANTANVHPQPPAE